MAMEHVLKSGHGSIAAPHARADRLEDIDRSKGIAIALVVLGHVVARDPPLGNDWYVTLKSAIYCFHMPLFMFLGGFIFFYSGNAQKPRPDYAGYVRRLAVRLLVPFFAISLLVLIAKSAAGTVLQVDNNPESFERGLISLVWNTHRSAALSVWYLFVSFVFCAGTPGLLKASEGRIWPLMLLAAVLQFISAPQILYLDRIALLYLYFVFGMACANCRAWAMSVIDRFLVLWIALFAATLAAIMILFDTAPSGPPFLLAAIGLLSGPAMLGLMRATPFCRSRLLLFLGERTFVIYMFNTFFIGATKAVLLKFTSWDGEHFILLFLPALMLAGLFGPIALKYALLDRVPALRFAG
jgi:fucose 4-O-acetylase-like acetyltransferase